MKGYTFNDFAGEDEEANEDSLNKEKMVLLNERRKDLRKFMIGMNISNMIF